MGSWECGGDVVSGWDMNCTFSLGIGCALCSIRFGSIAAAKRPITLNFYVFSGASCPKILRSGEAWYCPEGAIVCFDLGVGGERRNSIPVSPRRAALGAERPA